MRPLANFLLFLPSENLSYLPPPPLKSCVREQRTSAESRANPLSASSNSLRSHFFCAESGGPSLEASAASVGTLAAAANFLRPNDRRQLSPRLSLAKSQAQIAVRRAAAAAASRDE